MANSVIRLKQASSSGATPSALANGELGVDHFTGNLWFKAANGDYKLINPNQLYYSSVAANGTTMVAGVPSDLLTIREGRGVEITGVTANDTIFIAAPQSKSISIPSPVITDNVTLFYTSKHITITKISSVLQGIANSNVVFTIKSAAKRDNSSPKLMNTAGFVCANTSDGVILTTFDQPVINANSWIWLTTSFANGGTTELAVTMEF